MSRDDEPGAAGNVWALPGHGLAEASSLQPRGPAQDFLGLLEPKAHATPPNLPSLHYRLSTHFAVMSPCCSGNGGANCSGTPQNTSNTDSVTHELEADRMAQAGCCAGTSCACDGNIWPLQNCLCGTVGLTDTVSYRFLLRTTGPGDLR